MKASLQFREEKNPLLRMKLPVTVGGMHFRSGIVLGEAQDLALQIGTHVESCPSLKIAYQPNNPSSPFNLVFKFGLGPRGPSNDAAVTVSTHLSFSKTNSSTFFSIHVKPRFGDFGLRKMARLSYFKTMAADCRCKPAESALNLNSHGFVGISNGRRCNDGFDDVTPIKLDKNTMFTPILQRYPPHRRKIDTVGTESWAPDNVMIDNIYHFDRKSDKNSTFSDLSNRSLGCASVMNEKDIEVACNNVESMHPLNDLGSHDSKRGWTFHAYSMMSLTKQANVHIRWAVKMYPDVMQGWDDNFFTIKLPYLCLQKISIATPKYTMATHDLSEHGAFSEGDDDTCQLSPASALYCSMKPQLQHLHAENQALKKAIKNMRAQFEKQGTQNSSWYTGNMCDSIMEEEVNATAKLQGVVKEGRNTNHYET